MEKYQAERETEQLRMLQLLEQHGILTAEQTEQLLEVESIERYFVRWCVYCRSG